MPLIYLLLVSILSVSWASAAIRSNTQQFEMSLTEAVAWMTSLVSSVAVEGSGVCRRLLTLGGTCTCSFSDGADVTEATIEWDRHVYGRRRVCLDRFQPPSFCRTLVVTPMPYNANLAMFNRSVERFGCLHRLQTVTPPELVSVAAQRVWDLLDIMLMQDFGPVLSDVASGKIGTSQLTYTAMLDVTQLMDDAQTDFKLSTLQQHVKLAQQLQQAGFSVLSAIANPRCVHRVQRQIKVCLPISIDFTWISKQL